MLFQDALSLLKEGKCISRADWREEDGYIILLQGMKNAWKIITKPQPNAGNHIFNIEELSAEDWVEYDANKFLVCDQEPLADAA